MCLIHLLMLVLIYLQHKSSSIVDAFSTTTSSSSSRSTKPLQQIATTSAELLISIGRIQGTSMPEEWAASGAKLAFTLQVKFTDELANDNEQQKLTGDALMGSTLLKLKPINTPTFVTVDGTQDIDVMDGVYGSVVQNVESKLCSLRFCLETSGAVRNDVELPSNEHIYFLSTCWLLSSSSDDTNTNAVLKEASRKRKEIIQEIDLTNARANKIKSQQLSTNIIGSTVQQLFNFRHLLVLSERKNKLQQELDEIEKMYPLDSTQTIQGPNVVLFAKEGVVAVKRMKGTRLQYWYIGSFTINQFL